MRVGDTVSYIDGDGKRHASTITAVVGSGASGFKLLDLEYRGGIASAVAHTGDQAEGEGYWKQKGEATEPVEVPEEAPAPPAKRRKRKKS